MRVIGSFDKEDRAKRFSLFLKKMGVENSLEKVDGSSEVWVYNEDELIAAKIYLDDFSKNPNDTRFDVSLQDLPVEDLDKEIDLYGDEIKLGELYERKPIAAKVTLFCLISCIFIYLINLFQTAFLEKSYGDIFLLTPAQYYLLYDIPLTYRKQQKLLEKNKSYFQEKKVPVGLQQKLAQIEKIPYWKGFYDIIVNKLKGAKVDFSAPLFEKIRKFELWRIISPSFLHKDFLHLLFNLFWLWILGKQIEERLSKWSYILLIFLLAAITNTAQYLMSGPYFLGYSGVAMGLAGFIWSRQQTAPWEGYPLQKPVLIFLSFYILSILFLQGIIFVTEVLNWDLFSLNIANTAHVSGLAFGYLFGKFPLFAWRTVEH